MSVKRRSNIKQCENLFNQIVKIVNNLIEVKQVYGWAGIKRQLNRLIYAPKNTDNYQQWIDYYDTLTNSKKRKIRKRTQQFSNNPKVSIILTVNYPILQFLDETVLSVCSQIYRHWELYLLPLTATDFNINKFLENHEITDNRINVISYKNNFSVVQAINHALQQIKGEYVVFMEQGDKIPTHALFCIADMINKDPNIKLIYSDEDKIDQNGSRINPYFKCDWNPDLFLSQNMIGQLALYHIDLIRAIGGVRVNFEGDQNYDLALRCVEKINIDEIFHIPRILYHRRSAPKHQKALSQKKQSESIAGEKAINDYLKRNHINASVQRVSHGYRVRYKVQQPYPLVRLMIPTRNGYHLLRQCISSILNKTKYPNYQITIIDNGSDQQQTLNYLERLKQDYRITVCRDDGPFNHSALNNAALQTVLGDIVGLLNDDIEVISEDWMEEMVSHAIRPEVGAVGARLWYSDHTLQHGGMILGIGWSTGHSHRRMRKGDHGYFGRADLIQSFSALTGACLFVRKSLYEKVGGLDEHDFPTDYNDVDLCLKLRNLGYRNIWTPYAQLYHHESATRGLHITKEKRQRFIKASAKFTKKWGNIILKDPAYNPNLTLDNEDFCLAWPPRICRP